MKRILLSVMFIAFVSSWLRATPISLPAPDPAFNIQITINLHSKKSECNSGFGFCKLSIIITYQLDKSGPGISPEVRAEAMLGRSGELILKFRESDLSSYDNGRSMIYFKNRTSVTVGETYEIGEEIGRALGATRPLVIKPGEYRIEYDGSAYTIVIPQ